MRASDERAQTTQDFALGVGIFVLTVAFVVAYVPAALAPFEAGPTAADSAQADRLASSLQENITREGYGTRLNISRTNDFFAHHGDVADVRKNFSLERATNANVTLERLDGTPVNASANPDFGSPPVAGERTFNRSTASASRIVEYNGTQYRLVVRVWS